MYIFPTWRICATLRRSTLCVNRLTYLGRGLHLLVYDVVGIAKSLD